MLLAAPDSLWINFIYAGLLVGDALRGLDVWIIAPAESASPAPGQPETTRARTSCSRLLIIRRELAPEIAAAAGDLRVGVDNPSVSVGDIAGRFLAMSQTFRSCPLPQELLRFHARSRAVSQPHGRAAEGWELRVRFPCGSRSRAGSQASPQGEFRHECRRLSEDHHSPRVAGLPAPLHPRAGPPRHGEGGVQGPPSRRERARAPGGRAFSGSIRAL